MLASTRICEVNAFSSPFLPFQVEKYAVVKEHEHMKFATGPLARPAEPSLTVAAVARQLGVAPSTLRTWDRRYGLGPSEHQDGTNRRYSAHDLARLLIMRRLVVLGVSPAQAAQQALNSPADATTDVPSLVNTAIPEKTHSEEASQKAIVDILVRAARVFDQELLETILRRELAARGVVRTWNDLLIPLLTEVGATWEKSGAGIEVEHLLSEIVKRVLAEPLNNLKAPLNARPVLLACVGEENHSLAIRALAAALAESQIESQFLGARTPQVALNEVIRRVAPPAIFLWAQLSQNADLTFIHDIPAVRPTPRIIIGGPGWNGTSCERAIYAADLASARLEISRAVGL